MMGALLKASPLVKVETVKHDVEKKLKSKGDRVIQGNYRAIDRAYEEVQVG
jgi:Pyruvate/2-oxoacid:ferredoxin oxidoreductase gamma subunit